MLQNEFNVRILVDNTEDAQGLLCVRVRPASPFGSAMLSLSVDDRDQGQGAEQGQGQQTRRCAERLMQALRDRAQIIRLQQQQQSQQQQQQL